MKKLLKRWAELEPERCWFGNLGFSLVYDDEEYAGTLLLQLALQEAIEVRGWSWSVWHNFSEGASGESHYSAFVDIIKGEDAMPGDLDHSSTAAEALLTAYLAAIEAQTTEDADAE